MVVSTPSSVGEASDIGGIGGSAGADAIRIRRQRAVVPSWLVVRVGRRRRRRTVHLGHRAQPRSEPRGRQLEDRRLRELKRRLGRRRLLRWSPARRHGLANAVSRACLTLLEQFESLHRYHLLAARSRRHPWSGRRRPENVRGGEKAGLLVVVPWRQPLREGPCGDDQVFERVIRETEELQHWQHEVGRFRQEVRVVLHAFRDDKAFPCSACPVQGLTMSPWHDGVLPPMNQQQGRIHGLHQVLIRKALVDEVREAA
mmetsp:Transcript_125457/g.360556  ORF Transcript_125457/g.360556 Transcript_125457/m.360556 type:complete len:257 (+) Transcript_125457:679-1449(+)